jgi:hypothetical protein
MENGLAVAGHTSLWRSHEENNLDRNVHGYRWSGDGIYRGSDTGDTGLDSQPTTKRQLDFGSPDHCDRLPQGSVSELDGRAGCGRRNGNDWRRGDDCHDCHDWDDR